MSNCQIPMPTYAAPGVDYVGEKPVPTEDGIHGAIHWDTCDRPSALSFARYVNGVERKALAIDLDGDQYTPDECGEMWVIEGGRIVAITFPDGLRFVPERTCHVDKHYLDNHSELTVDICSECGVPIDEDVYYCGNCGARVVDE